jgi:hypothetical protein
MTMIAVGITLFSTCDPASPTTTTTLLQVGLVFPVLRHRFGTARVLAGFALVCAAAATFVQKFVPETKGRSLEDLS